VSERKWTPGKWKRDALAVRVVGKGIIARIPTPRADGVFECYANATLIAEAPALYEELVFAESVISHCRSIFNDSNFTDRYGDGEMMDKALVRIRAALTSARGEQP